MGVIGLFCLIKKITPESLSNVGLDQMKGWKVGIDASIFIYQWVMTGHKLGVKNKLGEPINHLQGMLFRTKMLLAAGITPIYCFDGKPPAVKEAILAMRAAAKKEKGLPSISTAIKDCQMLLDLMGVSWCVAPGEAEAQLAYMNTLGVIDAVVTNDIDAIVFGAKKIIRGLDCSAKSYVVVDGSATLKLSHGELVDLSILIGSDYAPPLKVSGKKYGPKKFYDLIKKHGSIEKILASEQIIPQGGFDFNSARQAFLNPNVKPVEHFADWTKISNDSAVKLKEFLVGKGLEKNRIDRTINEITDNFD